MLHRLALALALTTIPFVPACATVPRRAEVVSLASRILACPPDEISVRVGPIDQICTDRSGAVESDGGVRTGACSAWMSLDLATETSRQGWIVEGCGHVDRYATPECGDGGIYPAEIALGGFWDCPAY